MKAYEFGNLLLASFTLIMLFFTMVFAKQIGDKQNEINEYLKRMEDQVEIYAYVQPVLIKKVNSTKEALTNKEQNNQVEPKLSHWKIILTNVGKVHVYINSYKLSTIEKIKETGDTLLPAGQQQNAWYGIDLPLDVKEFELIVKFTDYLGRKGESKIVGNYDGIQWLVNSQKRVLYN